MRLGIQYSVRSPLGCPTISPQMDDVSEEGVFRQFYLLKVRMIQHIIKDVARAKREGSPMVPSTRVGTVPLMRSDDIFPSESNESIHALSLSPEGATLLPNEGSRQLLRDHRTGVQRLEELADRCGSKSPAPLRRILHAAWTRLCSTILMLSSLLAHEFDCASETHTFPAHF